jgi:glycosyltransferase involved in cell wall biosynthesis
VGPAAPDYFADNIGDALSRGGHQVTQLGPARAAVRAGLAASLATLARQRFPQLDERAHGRIVTAATQAGCEVVICLDAQLSPGAVSLLKRAGMRVAFWFPDHVGNLGRQFMLLASYDAVFFKEPWLAGRLRAMLDLPVYYLPQGCNPRWHRPLGAAGTEPHLVIAGNMYPSRVRLLERLIAKDIPVRVYGTGFPRWIGATPVRAVHAGRAVFREEKARVFRSAAGVLNTMYPAEVDGVNARLFEAAGCGAAVLTEWRPTVGQLFRFGDEVLAYRDFDELVDQAARLLSEPGLTARLGDAAAARAHSDHSYDLRVATILEKLS